MSSQTPEQNGNAFLGGHYINFAKKDIQPPTERYVSANDKIYVAMWNSVANIAVTLKGRMWLKNGSISEVARRFLPTSDRVINEYFITIPSGFLVDVVIMPEGATKRGQTFVHVALYQGGDNSNNRNAVLIQNYLQSGNSLSYPRSTMQDTVEGRGVLRTITGTNPAAGANISETVPTNARWRLISLFATLVTDATAANRFAALNLDDATSAYFRNLYFDAAVASNTYNFAWGIGLTHFNAAQQNFYNGHIPDNLLKAGDVVSTAVINLQAGDNWGAPTLLVEEWIEA